MVAQGCGLGHLPPHLRIHRIFCLSRGLGKHLLGVPDSLIQVAGGFYLWGACAVAGFLLRALSFWQFGIHFVGWRAGVDASRRLILLPVGRGLGTNLVQQLASAAVLHARTSLESIDEVPSFGAVDCGGSPRL